MKKPWQTLSSKIVYQNPWYAVRQDEVIRPDGKPGTYSVVEVKPSVYVVAINDQNEVAIVSMYRYTTDMFSLEVPAGGSEGQDLLVAAKRELQEETGMIADYWQKIGFAQSYNGICNGLTHVFLAKGLTGNHENQQLEEGISEVVFIPLKKAMAMVRDGQITDDGSISALTFAALATGLFEV